MSDATLDDVFDAVFDAVAALGPEGLKSFKAVQEFGGELTAETISQAVSNRLPAALIALAGEDPNGPITQTTTGEFEQIVRASLVIYVVTEAVRGARRARKPAADSPAPPAGPKGIHRLASEVIAVTNGLYVPGLWGTGRVHYAGYRSSLFRPGNTGALVVYAVRLQTDRPAEQVGDLPSDAYSAPAVPLAGVRGGVNVDEDDSDLTGTNPVSTANTPT